MALKSGVLNDVRLPLLGNLDNVHPTQNKTSSFVSSRKRFNMSAVIDIQAPIRKRNRPHHGRDFTQEVQDQPAVFQLTDD